MAKLNSDLGREYAKMLRPRSLLEIGDWCDMAVEGLSGGMPVQERDARQFAKLAGLCRDMASASEGEA